LSGDPAALCCVRHEPSLTPAKIDSAYGALESGLVCTPEMMMPGSISFGRPGSTSPGTISAVGPPIYIAFSTLRI